jgi:hypothetical protein
VILSAGCINSAISRGEQAASFVQLHSAGMANQKCGCVTGKLGKDQQRKFQARPQVLWSGDCGSFGANDSCRGKQKHGRASNFQLGRPLVSPPWDAIRTERDSYVQTPKGLKRVEPEGLRVRCPRFRRPILCSSHIH